MSEEVKEVLKEEVEGKISKRLEGHNYSLMHIILVAFVCLFLGGTAWTLVERWTGGVISKPRTDADRQIECVRRVINKIELDDPAFRVAIKICIPEE